MVEQPPRRAAAAPRRIAKYSVEALARRRARTCRSRRSRRTRSPRELAVVLQPDLDAVGRAPASATRCSGQLGLLSTDRDADDRRRRGAARRGSPSSPSRSRRRAGARRCARAGRACGRPGRAWRAWASSRVGVVVDEAGARVRHRRAEHDAGRSRCRRRSGARSRRRRGAGSGARRGAGPPPAAAAAGGRARRAGGRHALPPGGPPHSTAVLGGGVAHRLDHREDVAVGLDLTGDVGPARPSSLGHHSRRRSASGWCTYNVPALRAGPSSLPSHSSIEVAAARRAARRRVARQRPRPPRWRTGVWTSGRSVPKSSP